MSTLTVERPGMFTTVQDGGRWGFARWGVPASGPMDRWSARLANRLAGNHDGAAVLEVTVIGPRFQCGRRCRVAVTGAEFEVEVGGRRMRSPFVEIAEAGEPIVFGERRGGARAYVAIDGSFRLPAVLGSVAAHVRGPFTGLAGRALRTGDQIELGEPASPGSPLSGDAFRSWWDQAVAGDTHVLRVLRTQPMAWNASAFEALRTTAFVISPRSDRMGYRLGGKADWGSLPGVLLSGPTTLGAVQVPPGGEPILLMADHQTTGGYAQIAVVCRADRQVAGQLGPGDRVRFAEITMDEARAAHADRERALTRLASQVSA
jgi:antagonist of KipI